MDVILKFTDKLKPRKRALLVLSRVFFGLTFTRRAWNFGQARQHPYGVTKVCAFVRDVTDKHLCASPPSSAVCFLLQEEVLVCGWEVSSFTTPQQCSLSDTYQTRVARLIALDVTPGGKDTQLLRQTIETYLILPISCEADLINSSVCIFQPSRRTCLLCYDQRRRTAYVTIWKKREREKLKDVLQASHYIASHIVSALGVMCSYMCIVYLSIWSGVGDFSVSATSQFNPFTHMVISSSDVAIFDKISSNSLHFFVKGLRIYCVA